MAAKRKDVRENQPFNGMGLTQMQNLFKCQHTFEQGDKSFKQNSETP